MNERTHLDLFTGIAGFTLAARANGVRTVGMCECEEWLAKGLESAWGVTVHRDVRKLDARQYRGVWLVTAGTPCQPASRAGKQGGSRDNRWLWPETIRVIGEARPRWALLENPPGIDDVGLGGIIAQVAGLGYEVGICSIPACAVNSPQDRERYWIIAGPVADSESTRLEVGARLPSHARQECQAAKRNAESGVVADSQRTRQTTTNQTGSQATNQVQKRGGLLQLERDTWGSFEWLVCPDRNGHAVRRVPIGFHELAHGLPARIPRKFYSKFIAALGNAICWPVAAEIIKAMIASDL